MGRNTFGNRRADAHVVVTNAIPLSTLWFSGRSQARASSSDQAKEFAEDLAAHAAGKLVSKSAMELVSASVRADLGLAK